MVVSHVAGHTAESAGGRAHGIHGHMLASPVCHARAVMMTSDVVAQCELSTAQVWLVRTVCADGNRQHCAGIHIVGAFGAGILATNVFSLHVRLTRT